MPGTTTSVPAPASLPGANLSVLVGTLGRPPERRELPSGETVLELEVGVRADDRPLETVPVVWYGAPPASEGWLEGERVLVTGRTRRRFFRSGGATVARTEVVAAVVVPTRRRRPARAALEAAAGELLGVLDP